MKRIVILFAFLLSTFAVQAQKSSWKGFFKPIDMSLFEKKTTASIGTTMPAVWLFRPTVELTALQLVWNPTIKSFDASSLQSGGFGISYQHFIDVAGAPYNNFGVNALLLFDTNVESTNLALAGAITVQYQFLNVGAGYNFGIKKVFLMTGIVYNFNRIPVF